MAGLTREAKAARERLPDRISIGVLAKTFSKQLLEEVIDAADVREVRYRLLPARMFEPSLRKAFALDPSSKGAVAETRTQP